MLGLLGHFFSFLGQDSSTTDWVTILVENLAILADGLSHEVLWVALGELSPGFAVRTNNFTSFANLETFKNG